MPNWFENKLADCIQPKVLAGGADAASEKECCPRLSPDKVNHGFISNSVSISSKLFKFINNSAPWR